MRVFHRVSLCYVSWYRHLLACAPWRKRLTFVDF
ncbi:MAG: hypothetical protein DRR42_15155 [Gammaproteobacteria bacterium]|nr:MAG: hypothetical protein DRR42_15155 [Gammaproteobacteria bacterium]